MAYLEMHFHSNALDRQVAINVLLPEVPKASDAVGKPQGPCKTLYLYHGLSGDQSVWMRRTSIERYAAKYNLAVIMPNVDRSWYTDMATGANYFTFVTQELPQVVRSYFKDLSPLREDNLVAGLSMGGYGAVKAALSCPETFGACASLSGSLDITRKNRSYILAEWQAIFGFNLKSADELEGTQHDLFALTRKNHAKDLPFPKLYLWCGTEDSLLSVNRDYRDLLNELNIPHTYKESEGNHSWPWWDLHIQDALACLLNPNI